MDPLVVGFLIASAFAAGVINSVAGGGTLLTFPALVAVLDLTHGDQAAAVANATSTVALLPGSFAGAWAYRKEFAQVKAFAVRLLPVSAIGGVLGALLLKLFPKEFGPIVPWLILTAAVLFLLQPPMNKYLAKRREAGAAVGGGQAVGVVAFQFLVAVYGGYFGAGIGILMLTALGFMGVASIHHANAVKTLLAGVINAVSVVVFVFGDLIEWSYAAVMAVAAIAGGYAGARVARRLPATYVRWVVIAIGFVLSGYYLWKQFGAKG